MDAQEWLCLWYLRLNGYLTIPGFVVHSVPAQLTDVDVLGIRFPYSHEPCLKDDPALGFSTSKADIVLAEGKRGRASLNGPWSKPEKGIFEYALRRVGMFSNGEVESMAAELYSKRAAASGTASVRIVCFAEVMDQALTQQGVHFVSWESVLKFLHRRFRENEKLKSNHPSWDNFGTFLWECLQRDCPRPADFFVMCDKARKEPEETANRGFY